MKCVHCLIELEDETRDHVFPRAWYPDNTPVSVQRPTVPSCPECNNNFSRMEQELLVKIGACIAPEKLEASGINKKLLRSLGIGNESELTVNELKIRRGNLKKLMSQIKPFDPKIKPFPGLGLHKNYPPEAHSTIPVPEKELKSISLKIMKGLEYSLNNKRYVENPYKSKVYFVDEGPEIKDVYTLLANYGTKTSFGPGFVVERAQGNKEPHIAVLYRITVWDTLKIYGSIML